MQTRMVRRKNLANFFFFSLSPLSFFHSMQMRACAYGYRFTRYTPERAIANTPNALFTRTRESERGSISIPVVAYCAFLWHSELSFGLSIIDIYIHIHSQVYTLHKLCTIYAVSQRMRAYAHPLALSIVPLSLRA